jgi:hypothetical protein
MQDDTSPIVNVSQLPTALVEGSNEFVPSITAIAAETMEGTKRQMISGEAVAREIQSELHSARQEIAELGAAAGEDRFVHPKK